MLKNISSFSIVVDDYDKAIAYYTQKLGFILLEDTDMGNGKRWVRVSPSKEAQTAVILAKAKGEKQIQAIGNQTGGRVFLFLATDNFDEDYPLLKSKGINFLEEPREETYGKVAIFQDCYGNKWDFIQYY